MSEIKIAIVFKDNTRVGTVLIFFGRKIVVWHNPLTEFLLKVYLKISAPWDYLQYLRYVQDMRQVFPEDFSEN